MLERAAGVSLRFFSVMMVRQLQEGRRFTFRADRVGGLTAVHQGD